VIRRSYINFSCGGTCTPAYRIMGSPQRRGERHSRKPPGAW